MRPILACLLAASALMAQAPAPKPDPFAPLRFLEGTWKDEGGGLPGQMAGAATFRFELGGRTLVRQSYADAPASPGRPASHHEDLMTIFVEGGQLKALYLDNEDHVIRYLVAPTASGAVLTSEAAPGPRFRLSYLQAPEGAVTVRFEIAPPQAPEAFKTYLEAATRRVK